MVCNHSAEYEYYSGKFRLWVDRPEKVNFSIGINRSITNLVFRME